MAAWSLSKGCGTCPSVGKRVVATVALNGYPTFITFAGTWNGGWVGGVNSFTVGQYVKQITGSSPNTSATIYICKLNIAGSATAPSADGSHWTNVAFSTAQNFPHNNLAGAWSSANAYPTPVIVTDAGSFFRNRGAVLAGGAAPHLNTAWELYYGLRQPFFSTAANRYAQWTERTDWSCTGGNCPTPSSGSVSRIYTHARYDSNRISTLTTDDLHPQFTYDLNHSLQSGYHDSMWYPALPAKPIYGVGIFSTTLHNFSLTDVLLAATSQRWDWRLDLNTVTPPPEAPSDQVWVLSQFIDLATELTQADAVAEAQALIDTIGLADVAWGEKKTLVRTDDGDSVVTSGGVVIGQGTNYVLGIQSTKGKGEVKIIGSGCHKQIPRTAPGTATCVTIDAGCAGDITVNPPAFDGDENYEGGCACPP